MIMFVGSSDNMDHDIHEAISLEKYLNDDFCVNLTKSSSMQYSLQDANDVQESSRLYSHNLPYTSMYAFFACFSVTPNLNPDCPKITIKI